MGPDQAATTPATAQITVADVVGTVWVPFNDGGVPLSNPATGQPIPTHSLAVVADFPMVAGADQHSTGTTLHGCTWNRYNLLPPSAGGTGPFPAPNENAGSVNITGYDTGYTLPVDTTTGNPAPPTDPNVNCSYNAMTMHFDCYFGTDKTKLVSRYIFPTTPFAAVPSPTPSPSPGTAPPAWNTDLYKSGFGDPMVDNAVKESFTPSPPPSTYTDARMTNLTGLPKAPHVVTINGNASTTELDAIGSKFDGTNDITIVFSCDGTSTAGGGCSLGGISAMLVQTSLGKKWEPQSGANQLRFGTAQCVEADDGTSTHTFTLTKQMIADILGSDMNQSIRIVMVRLKANTTVSGMHPFYETAGRGVFSFLDQ
jgi:hypothetical protein